MPLYIDVHICKMHDINMINAEMDFIISLQEVDGYCPGTIGNGWDSVPGGINDFTCQNMLK
jgi:hypothetical protein